MEYWLYLLIACIIIRILWKSVKGKVKGVMGEKNVAVILQSLPKSQYLVLNNIMIPTKYGTSQIDHIVVSIYGIFVIETKNYKGWITGSENGDKWIKNMYGKKYPFRNPIKQNYGHIKALQELLNVPKSAYVSIIAFSPKTTIKVKTSNHVIHFSKLKRVIKSYSQKILEADTLEMLAATIRNANVNSQDNRKAHVQSIRQNIHNEEQLAKQRICPKCGGQLVKRKGKYGTFWGCSKYPKCSYTKN